MKERLADVVYSSRSQWSEKKLERTLGDTDKLREKYRWLQQLGREYMIE